MLTQKKNSSKTVLLILLMLLSSLTIAQKKPELRIPPLPEPEVMATPSLLDTNTENQYLKSLNNMLRMKLNKIKRFDKKAYQRLLQKSYFNSMDIPFFNSFDQKRQKMKRKISSLEIETTSLAMSYKNDTNADKVKIKKELKEKLGELFLIKEKNKEQDVERLEKRLNDLKKSLTVRSKHKDEIIKRRLNQLIGEAKYLDWNE